MPWDMIQPAVYNQTTDIQPLLDELRARHADRVENNVDFNYFEALAAKSREASDRTHLSLNEAARKTEKESDDKWRLDLENSLRKAHGKPVAATLDELEELQEAEIEAEEAEDEAATEEGADGEAVVVAEPVEDPIEDVDNDAMVEEAGKILLDMIGLSIQLAQVENVQGNPALGNTVPLPTAVTDSQPTPKDG